MTADQMKQEFLILYDKITNFSAPGYEDVEISVFLTKAQERVVLSRIRSVGNKYKEGFEESEIRRIELQELVKGVSISIPSTDQANTLPFGSFFDLPADFQFSISEEVTTDSTDSCKDGVRLRVKPTTHDEYAINVKNPFKKPNIKRYVWRLNYQDRKCELITDGTFAVETYHLRYLKTLSPIVIGAGTVDGATGPLDCELNNILQKRIIDEAVKIATGITDPEKYQLKSVEQQSGE